LVIVGGRGWGMESLMLELETLQSSGEGKYLAYVSRQELFSLLQSAQALVYPSLYEGFGLPVLEGFASNIPVITSNTTSLPEVAGDAALCVDPTSTDAILDAMWRVVEDPTLAKSLVLKGQQRVKQFSWEKCAQATIEVYQKVCG